MVKLHFSCTQVEYQEEYEPFVVVKRHQSVYFDERFLERFYNKIVFIMDLARKG